MPPFSRGKARPGLIGPNTVEFTSRLFVHIIHSLLWYNKVRTYLAIHYGYNTPTGAAPNVPIVWQLLRRDTFATIYAPTVFRLVLGVHLVWDAHSPRSLASLALDCNRWIATTLVRAIRPPTFSS